MSAQTASASVTGVMMSGAEVEAARTELGLTVVWMAQHLGVTTRAYYNWMNGRSASIPHWVPGLVDEMRADAEAKVDEILGGIMVFDQNTMIVYRDDEQLPQAWKDSGYPASWWFRIAVRVVAEGRRAGRQIRLQYGGAGVGQQTE